MKLKVYNKKFDDYPDDVVYCGRGSIFGNDFSHLKQSKAKFRTSSLEESIEKHKNYVLTNKDFIDIIKINLKGKNLLCYCKPKPCHCDILLEIANENVALTLEKRIFLYKIKIYVNDIINYKNIRKKDGFFVLETNSYENDFSKNPLFYAKKVIDDNKCHYYFKMDDYGKITSLIYG